MTLVPGTSPFVEQTAFLPRVGGCAFELLVVGSVLSAPARPPCRGVARLVFLWLDTNLFMHDNYTYHALPHVAPDEGSSMADLVTISGGADAGALAALARYSEEARGSFAPNTLRAMRADTAIFSAWCAKAGVNTLPADDATVAAFVDAMSAEKAPATVRRYVASVSHMHIAAKISPNPAASQAVKSALRRMNRAKGIAQKQVAPLNRTRLDRMLAATDQGVRGLRNRALLAVAYDTLCRRSELVQLTRADLEINAAGDGTVTVRRSKTDQEGAGMVRYVAADTMRELSAWLAVAGVVDGPLFRAVNKAGAVGGGLDPGDVARVFKKMARAAAVSAQDVARISGHSTRVGAAQDMVSVGLEMPAAMQAGGWKTSVMVARYTAKLDAKRSGAAKLAVLQSRG